MIKTQLLVIGAGPGGYAAAFAAADMGMEVTLVDLDKNPGGVCLFRGCIPSKALLHVAKLINETKEAKHWGVDFGEPKINLDQLREFKNKVVGKMTGGLGQLAKQRKINFVQGRATFTSSRSVKVDLNDGGKDEIHFEKAIIAIGSEIATIPAFNIKSDRLLNSTSALDLPAIPERMLVIGGGYIGLELGSVYSALGTKVSVVEMTNGLLPGADRDMVNYLQQMLKKKFESIMLESRVMKLEPVENGINVTIQDKTGAERVEFYDYVLASIGRRPNTAGLGLETTKVELTPRGHIKVDNTLKTTDQYIYAIGDIAGDPMLAHKASHEARVAVESIAGHRVAFAPAAIPAVVFTDPEIAWAGITETEAREKGIKHEVAKFPWAASGRATTLDRFDGVTKLIIDPDTERILGVGICGPGAGELIAEGTLAIEMGAVASDLKLTIHPHPTLSETVMEAAEVFFGESVHLYRPKKK
ncbi:MAG: dihydrolipoyl dehydrogenase [Ignavibacteriaceae bacterium]|nr:MAG: dihydrolipoyl dehydrogenase [Chlorobiota bacterium]GJQ31757.1 MAG: dihydrolipoyl dehydrogenase [Ignavibacteriaceae bacterium]